MSVTVPKINFQLPVPKLRFPKSSDTYEDLARITETVNQILDSGRSIALALEHELNLPPVGDPVQLAPFTIPESILYVRWEQGLIPDPVDWALARLPYGKGACNELNAVLGVQALNNMYRTEGLTQENVRWFYTNKTDLIPLLNAFLSIEGAARNMTSGVEGVDPYEFLAIKKFLKSILAAHQGRRCMPAVSQLQITLRRRLAAIEQRTGYVC